MSSEYYIYKVRDKVSLPPYCTPDQFFCVGEITMFHENMPDVGTFPILKDGVWRILDAQVGIQGRSAALMDIVGARLRSLSKEEKNIPSGDQILFAPLDPLRVVVGVVDGITPVFNPEGYIPKPGSSVFQPRDIVRYKERSGENLQDVVIPSDTYPAILFSKMFPLSANFDALRKRPALTAKEIMVEGDAFIGEQYSRYPFLHLPSEYLPGAVASIALIDFQVRTISTAHIGDSNIGYDRWKGDFREEYKIGHEYIALSHDQNWKFDRDLFEYISRERIAHGTDKYRALVAENYRKKRNEPDGVGILNGQLNPTLIEQNEVSLDDVLTLLFSTDAVDTMGGNEVLNYAYHILVTGEIHPLPQLRNISIATDLPPIKRDDDGTVLSICFRESRHCDTSDWRGKQEYFEFRSDTGQKPRMTSFLYDETLRSLKPHAITWDAYW